MRKLGDALGVSDVINISQAFLLSGSLNFVDSRSAMHCRLDEDDSSWLRYSFEELKEATERACEVKKVKLWKSRAGEGAVNVLPATLEERGVPEDVMEAIVTGRLANIGGSPSVESRDYQERDLWIMIALFDYGFSKEEVKAIFRSNPEGCGARLAREKNGERYLEHTIKTASALRGRQRRGDSLEDEEEEYVEMPQGYESDPDGSIWFRPAKQEGDRKTPKPVKVSDSYIGIAGIREDIDTGHISVTIECEYLGRTRQMVIERAQMANARQLVSALGGQSFT